MADDSTHRDIGELKGSLGELRGEMKGIDKRLSQIFDLIKSQDMASNDSRARLHERVDEVSDRLGKIEGDIGIAGQIDAQVRNELDALRSTMEANRLEAAPAIEAWQDVLKTGKRVSWVFGIAGITTIGGLLTIVTGAWEWLLKLVLRH